LRIVFLNTDANLGGAERCLLDLMASLRASFPSVRMGLILGGSGLLEKEAAGLGVDVRVLPLPPAVARLGDTGASGVRGAVVLGGRALAAAPAVQRYRRELEGVLASLEPDIVHSNSIKFHLLASLARARSAPIVWHLHDFVGARPVMARFLGWCASRARLALAVSKAVQEDARSVLPGLSVEVVYNAIDVTAFSPGAGDPEWLDRAAGFSDARAPLLRVGLVATYGVWKGHELFLEAAARVGRREIRYFVVGGPIYTTGAQVTEPMLRATAARLGIADRVGFVGFQADVAPVYRSLDIVVHASTKPEPFGRTIVEAMSCGRAVVACRAGGAAEVFEHGRDALGFESGNAEELAGAIDLLAREESIRARLGVAGRAAAVERFSRDRLGPSVMCAYERLLS